MEQEQERLNRIAIDLGINARMVRRGTQIEIEFDKYMDSARFRLRAHGNDYNPGHHSHTEHFKEGDERYRDAWVRHVQRSIDELGLKCRIVRNGNEVTFNFDWSGDLMQFSDLRNQNVYHCLALAEIDGPIAQL